MEIKRGQNYLLDVIWERTPPPPKFRVFNLYDSSR